MPTLPTTVGEECKSPETLFCGSEGVKLDRTQILPVSRIPLRCVCFDSLTETLAGQLDGFGESVAVDSTVVPTYSNPPLMHLS